MSFIQKSFPQRGYANSNLLTQTSTLAHTGDCSLFLLLHLHLLLLLPWLGVSSVAMTATLHETWNSSAVFTPPMSYWGSRGTNKLHCLNTQNHGPLLAQAPCCDSVTMQNQASHEIPRQERQKENDPDFLSTKGPFCFEVTLEMKEGRNICKYF